MPVSISGGCSLGEWYKPGDHPKSPSEWQSGLGWRWTNVPVWGQWGKSLNFTAYGKLPDGSYPLVLLNMPYGPPSDASITNMVTQINNFPGHVIMRYDSEMDRRSGESGDPTHFKAQWSRIRSKFNCPRGAMAFVPMNAGLRDGSALKFYPGKSNVDYNGWDFYSMPGSHVTPARDLIAKAYSWAVSEGKPVVIPEFGIATDAAHTEDKRGQWIAEFLSDIHTKFPLIKVAQYFNADRRDEAAGRDWRIRDSGPTHTAWSSGGNSSYFTAARSSSSGGTTPQDQILSVLNKYGFGGQTATQAAAEIVKLF